MDLSIEQRVPLYSNVDNAPMSKEKGFEIHGNCYHDVELVKLVIYD